MKSLRLLKSLIDIFLFFSLLGAIAVIVVVPMKLINPELGIPIAIRGVSVEGSDWLSILVIAMAGVGAFFFLYAIFVLRKVLILFTKREIFTDAVIRNFKIIGQCIIAATLCTTIPMFFYNMVARNNVGIEFNGGGFDSLLLSVSLGLLFIVIGEIFQHAKNIKDENELTV